MLRKDQEEFGLNVKELIKMLTDYPFFSSELPVFKSRSSAYLHIESLIFCSFWDAGMLIALNNNNKKKKQKERKGREIF